MASTAFAQDAAVRLYAAGSLRTVMTEMAQAFTASGQPPVTSVFGASGLLRERIEKGEAADLLASADVGHAQALSQAGRSGPVVVFARNRLCALVAPGIDATTETLLARLLDPAIKVGTSTPKADPSGDYAWQLFERAERLRAGAYAILDRKALQLTGGADSPPPPVKRSLYAMFIAERKADIFLTYCTNAAAVTREVPGARSVALPDALAVGASYGITVLNDARPAASRFAWFVLSTSGQAILERNGFSAVALP